MRRIRGHVRIPDDDPVRWRQALERAFIPDRYRAASLELITNAQVRGWVEATCSAAQTWLAEGRGWFIHGPLNNGKSSLAALLAMDALMRCERVFWCASRFVPGVIFRDEKTPHSVEMYEALLECDLFVLDDLGAESHRLTGPAGAALETAVRVVYDRGRSVVATSNLNWQDLTREYGAVIEPLVSVLGRITTPVQVQNNQWPDQPPGGEVIL